MSLASTRTVEAVAVDLATGEQVRFDGDDTIRGPDGDEIPLEDVVGALSGACAYIDYETESRYERDAEEEWRRETGEWRPAVCRVFSRHVAQVLTVYA